MYGADKDDIRQYVTDEFGYDLSRICDEIRPYYKFNETCKAGNMAEAFYGIPCWMEKECDKHLPCDKGR